MRFESNPRFGEILTLVAVLAAAFATLSALGWRLEEPKSALTSDLASYFAPKYEYAAAQLAEGGSARWNPLEFGGLPFAATIQPAVFYAPLRLAYSTFSIKSDSAIAPAYEAFIVLHLLLAAAFSYFMLRRIGCGAAAAAFGAAWIFHPAWLVRSYAHPNFLAGIIWLPLLILLIRQIVHAASLRLAVALAAAAALLAVSGYPPLVLAVTYVLTLGLPFWLWESRAGQPRVRFAHAGAALTLAILLAAGFAAIQLLPTLELTQLTERSSIGPRILARIEEHGAADPTLAAWARLLSIPPLSFESGLQRLWSGVGPLLLGLCLAAVAFAGRRPACWYFLVIAIAGNLLPYQWLAKLPFYEYVRYAIEWTYIGVFAVFAIAALGFQALVDRIPPLRRYAMVASVALLAGSITWSWHHDLSDWAPRNAPRPRPSLSASVIEACEVGLGRHRAFWPAGQARGALLTSRVPSVGGYEQSLIPGRTVEVARALSVGNGMVPGAWVDSFARNRGALSRLALACIVTPQVRESLAKAGYEELRDLAPGLFVYRNPDVLPPARLVSRARLVDSPEAALDALIGSAVTDADLVTFETSPPPISEDCAFPRAGTAEITEYRADSVTITTESSCDAYLVLADQYDLGWRVRVDGDAATLLRADFNLRAVRVPAGSHEAVFTYQPDSARAGRITSMIAGLLAVVLVAVPRRLDPVRLGSQALVPGAGAEAISAARDES